MCYSSRVDTVSCRTRGYTCNSQKDRHNQNSTDPTRAHEHDKESASVNSIALTSNIFTELANTMKYKGGGLI